MHSKDYIHGHTQRYLGVNQSLAMKPAFTFSKSVSKFENQ